MSLEPIPLPEEKVMSEQEKEEFWARMRNPEYWKNRYAAFNQMVNIFEQEAILMDYCHKNNCSIQDLIDAHKDRISKNQNY